MQTSADWQNNTDGNEAGVSRREPPSAVQAGDPRQNDFVVYAVRLWRARRFIAAVVVAGAVVSAIISFLLPRKYQSTARLMPPASRNSQTPSLLAGALSGPLATAGASALGIQSPSAIYEQILQSRSVQDHLIDQFDLRRVYATTTYEDARNRLSADTQIAGDRKSGVVTLIVTAGTPKLAEGLAAGYLEQLNTLMVQLDTSAAHRERVFLEGRLKGIEQDLDTYSTELGQFTSKNTVVAGEEQSKAVFTAAEVLRGQTIQAKADLQALQQIYTPDNARVRAAQARLDELQRELAKMRGGGADAETAPEGFPSIRELPLLGARYTGMYRQLAVEQSVYETLTRQYELAKVEEARDLPSVRVIDAANLPEKKSWPKRSLLVAASTFLAFLFSCAYVLGQAWWAESDSAWRHLAGEVAGDLRAIMPGLDRSSTIKAGQAGGSEPR